MQESENILRLLNQIKYRQHQKRMIIRILESYPSLQDELKKIIEMGANRIEIEQNHVLPNPQKAKPQMKKRGEIVVLYLND